MMLLLTILGVCSGAITLFFLCAMAADALRSTALPTRNSKPETRN